MGNKHGERKGMWALCYTIQGNRNNGGQKSMASYPVKKCLLHTCHSSPRKEPCYQLTKLCVLVVFTIGDITTYGKNSSLQMGAGLFYCL